MAKTDKYASTAMLLESQWDIVNKKIDGKEIEKEEIPNVKKSTFDVKEQGDKARKAKKEESSNTSSSKVQKDKNEEASSDSKNSSDTKGYKKPKLQKDEVEASADVEGAVKIAKKLAAYGEKKEDAVIEKAAKKILELLGVVESESSES